MKTGRMGVIWLVCVGFAGLALGADGPRSVAFRRSEWRAVRFDDRQEADEQLQTLKELGCETRVEESDRSIDVHFRAARWTKLTLDTQQEIDEWESWLKSYGFQTLHSRDEAPGRDAVVVQYRLDRALRKHLHDATQAKELTSIFTSLGCVIQQAQHSGHLDLTVSCPQWRNLTFDTHDEAHAMQKWLRGQGFQTKHSH